ncbi:MAG: hypothetical protein ABSE73_08805 [Planctomycetota bacterium]
MKTESLLGDPVFQLNLLLWMAKEQPADEYRVNPLFHKLGFKIRFIEDPFNFPETERVAATASGLSISTDPEPELILGRGVDGAALYIEAKKDSFGTQSSNCKQARGHLLATGPAFAEVLAPLKECLLCYVLPADKCQLMAKTLQDLAAQLISKTLRPGRHSVTGLALSTGSIVYSWDAAFRAHTGMAEDFAVLMTDVDDETDPSPLILVFTDEDSYNPMMTWFYRRAMLEQVRACLLCSLHNWEVGQPYQTSLQALLVKTTDNIFKYLGHKRQTNLIRLVRENLFKRIAEHWKDKQAGMVDLSGEVFTVTWKLTGQKDEFLDWLEDRRVTFAGDKPQPEEPLLFDDSD